MIRIMVVLAALTAANCAPHVGRTTEDAYVVYYDGGGFGGRERKLWEERMEDGRHLVIDGTCASFCAFAAFAHPDSCYTESAVIDVHPFYSINPLQDSGEMDALNERAMMLLPEGMRKVVRKNNPGFLGVSFKYDELRKMIPERECKS